MTTYAPVAVVTAPLVPPSTNTSAPATGAPRSSETLPAMEPDAFCARSGVAERNEANNVSAARAPSRRHSPKRLYMRLLRFEVREGNRALGRKARAQPAPHSGQSHQGFTVAP